MSWNSFEVDVYLAGDEMEDPIRVEVEFSVYGESRPATWGYYGGEPAEEPEVEISAVSVVCDEAPGGFAEGFELDPEELVGGWQELEDAAWEHLNNYDPY